MVASFRMPRKGLTPVVSFGSAPAEANAEAMDTPETFADGTGLQPEALPLPDGPGYSPEFDRLTQLFVDPSADAVALIGPPGLARSLLVRRAAEQAADVCSTFITGPDPSGAGTAWYPIVSLLKGILGLTGAPSGEGLTAALSESGLYRRELLGLADVFGLANKRGSVPDHIRRDQAMTAALTVLRSAIDLEPRAVLCFEDIGEYDQPSLQVIEELLAGDEARPPIIVTATSATVVPAQCESVIVDDGDAPVDELAARLFELDKASRLVLRAAAAYGTTTTVQGLSFFESVEAPTAECLYSLAAAGFIAHDGDTITFSSAALRDAVRASTPSGLNKILHCEINSAVELEVIHLSVCARAHHARAAGAEDVFDRCLAAARDSAQRFDDVGAVRWFACADELAVTAEQRTRAALGLAGALRRVGELEMARDALKDMDGAVPSNLRGAIDRERGKVALAANDVSAVGHFRLAIAHGLRTFDPPLLCDTYLELVDAMALTNDESRWGELTEAIDVVTLGEGYDTSMKLPALCALGWRMADYCVGVELVDRANALARAALTYAERIGADYARAKLLVVLSKVFAAQGDSAAADIHLGLAKEIFTRLGAGNVDVDGSQTS